MTNTIENKSTLAKLLATENIEVQENATQTASFDVVNRILTIPIFKEEHKSKHVYDMLIGHEVSHALHTPSESWKSMSDRSKEFRSFVNVIEDARIDKLIQSKYPGLTVDYVEGFKKLYADNFFGTKDKDINKDYTLIDKINLWFKSSKNLDIKFTSKENKFVEAVDNCKSFDDVLKLAEEILGHCKEELKKQPKLAKSFQISKEKSEGDESESEQDSMSADEKLDQWVEKQEGDDEEGEEGKKEIQTPSIDAGGELRSLTNEAYDIARQNMANDGAEKRIYCELPKVNLKDLIIPYSKFIRDNAIYDSKHDDYNKESIKKAKEDTKKFINESSNVVNYLVKEFEMKKNAKLYARASQDKTGIIDPLKLHTYKFAEDIFKKITLVPNQKNHGMILLLDWSGSMQKHLLPTVEQLLNLTMFCKKINIPFSVYAFMNPDSKTDNTRKPFTITKKTLQADQTTKLVQLFSHKQTKVEFTRVAELIHRAAKYFSGYGYRRFYGESVPSIDPNYYLSSTPLNESLIAMDTIIKKFKNDYKTEKLALVTLTDGASNSCTPYESGQVCVKLSNKYVKTESYWRNNNKSLTSVLLKYLQKKYDLQTIGFYLASKFRDLQFMMPSMAYDKTEIAKKMFAKDKFIPDYTTVYDVYFYVKSDTKVENSNFSDIQTTDKRSLKKLFMSGMKKRLTSRILLQNFIKRIA